MNAPAENVSENLPKIETKIVHKQNGVKRPESGTLTGALWDLADHLSEKQGGPAPRKAVVDSYMASVPGANVATANTQYARWVRYHNVSEMLAEGREAAKAEKAAAKLAEKQAAVEAKAAEKAAAEEAKAAEKQAKAEKAAADKAAKEAEKAEKKAAKEAEAKAAAEAKAQAKAAADAAKAEAAAAAGA